jgi:hypothetical protein
MGDQRRAATPPRRGHGTHIAIAAIAAFALLLVFVLFYRGDRPTDEPLAMSAEEEASLRSPIRGPDEAQIGPAPEDQLDDAGSTSGPGALQLTPDEAQAEGIRSAPRNEPSARLPRQKRPRTDLSRPELELGGKPAELQLGRQAAVAREKDIGRMISAEEIRRVVGENERDVKNCLENLSTGRSVAQSKKIEVELKVVPSGAVADASVKNVIRSAESDCIETKAKNWRFKETGGEISQQVTVPFVVVSGTG